MKYRDNINMFVVLGQCCGRSARYEKDHPIHGTAGIQEQTQVILLRMTIRLFRENNSLHSILRFGSA